MGPRKISPLPLVAAGYLLFVPAANAYTSQIDCPTRPGMAWGERRSQIEARANDNPPVPCTSKYIGNPDSYNYETYSCGTFKVLRVTEGLNRALQRIRAVTRLAGASLVFTAYSLTDKKGRKFSFSADQTSHGRVFTCSEDGNMQSVAWTITLESEEARVVIVTNSQYVLVPKTKAEF